MATARRRHKVGTYNVEYGHPVRAHAEMIMKRFEGEHLDVLALVEVADYVHELAQLAHAAGHHLLYVTGPENVINQALLVRKGCEIGRVHSVEMDAYYFAPNGDKRRSEDPLVAVVDGILYVVVHTPVGAWVAGKGGRHWFGPIRRRIAFRKYVNRLALIFKRHPHMPICVLGDWNTTPVATGPNSAEALARKVDAHIVRPHASTGHGEIDFAVVRGVEGTLHVEKNVPGLPKSDHLLVTGTIAA